MRALAEEIGIPIEVSILYRTTYKPRYVNDDTLNLSSIYKRREKSRKLFPKIKNLTDNLSRVSLPLSQVYGPEATMTGICQQAIQYITAAA